MPFKLGHRPALDGLRGVAITLVVLYHFGLFWPDAGPLAVPGGFLGVDLFFALSGFLITAVLIGELDKRDRIALPRFLLRRGLRLVPPLAAVVGAVVVGVAMGWIPGLTSATVEDAAWTLTFMQAWPGEGHLLNPELGQTWSLAIEGQFYVVWSVLTAGMAIALPPRSARPALLATAVVLVLAVAVHRAQQVGVFLSFDLYLYSPYRLDSPLVGAIGGLVYANSWTARLPGRWAARAAVGGLAVLFAAAAEISVDTRWLYLGGLTGFAVLGTFVTVAVAMADEGRLFRFLSSGPMVLLGKASYSIFLWHMPVIVVVQREAVDWPTWAQVGLAAVLAAGLSALSYIVIERPILDRLRSRPRAEAEDGTEVIDLADGQDRRQPSRVAGTSS